ncbi:MAG: hypothetical protein KBS91_03475, partial [Firmicutes bacterium]|nr:hypothetical protein [Candidatus Caballimonas caccae]
INCSIGFLLQGGNMRKSKNGKLNIGAILDKSFDLDKIPIEVEYDLPDGTFEEPAIKEDEIFYHVESDGNNSSEEVESIDEMISHADASEDLEYYSVDDIGNDSNEFDEISMSYGSDSIDPETSVIYEDGYSNKEATYFDDLTEEAALKISRAINGEDFAKNFDLPEDLLDDLKKVVENSEDSNDLEKILGGGAVDPSLVKELPIFESAAEKILKQQHQNETFKDSYSPFGMPNKNDSSWFLNNEESKQDKCDSPLKDGLVKGDVNFLNDNAEFEKDEFGNVKYPVEDEATDKVDSEEYIVRNGITYKKINDVDYPLNETGKTVDNVDSNSNDNEGDLTVNQFEKALEVGDDFGQDNIKASANQKETIIDKELPIDVNLPELLKAYIDNDIVKGKNETEKQEENLAIAGDKKMDENKIMDNIIKKDASTEKVNVEVATSVISANANECEGKVKEVVENSENMENAENTIVIKGTNNAEIKSVVDSQVNNVVNDKIKSASKKDVVRVCVDDGSVVCDVCGHLNKNATGVCEMCSNYLKVRR